MQKDPDAYIWYFCSKVDSPWISQLITPSFILLQSHWTFLILLSLCTHYCICLNISPNISGVDSSYYPNLSSTVISSERAFLTHNKIQLHNTSSSPPGSLFITILFCFFIVLYQYLKYLVYLFINLCTVSSNSRCHENRDWVTFVISIISKMWDTQVCSINVYKLFE